MSCNRQGCPIPGDHIHLPRADERAVARVLLAHWDAQRRNAAAKAPSKGGK